MLSVIRAAERRRTLSPVGTMTTLVSPTLGGATGWSLWEVAMAAGATGPLHVFDSEQLWTVLDGDLAVTVAGETADLGRGDTVVMPAGLERQVVARSDVRLVVCGHAGAVARVPGESEARGTPAWIV